LEFRQAGIVERLNQVKARATAQLLGAIRTTRIGRPAESPIAARVNGNDSTPCLRRASEACKTAGCSEGCRTPLLEHEPGWYSMYDSFVGRYQNPRAIIFFKTCANALQNRRLIVQMVTQDHIANEKCDVRD